MSEVPSSWAVVPIVDVLVPNLNGKPFQQGWSPQCENHPASSDQWGVLKTTAIQQGQYWGHENKQLPEDLEPRPHIEVCAGDLLMTCAGPRSRCGVVCLVERTRSKLMLSGKMYRFRPDEQAMDARFLTYYFQTRTAQLAIDRMKTGISDSGLNLTHDRFATLSVPLAPLPEQRRIVAKIEELFSELDKGVESLTAAGKQLKTYRQSILNYAFQGKLHARQRHHGGLADIQRSYPSLSSAERTNEHLNEPPDGWSYVRLSDLVDKDRPITYGVIKLGADVSSGIPTLRSSDVRNLRLDLGSVKRISPEIAGQYQRTFLQGGEVLITVRGTLGGVAVVPVSVSGWNISREVAMIAPVPGLDPYYLQYLLASPQLASWLKVRLRGIAYTGINLETLRAAPILICSVEEQRQIAKVIEERMSLVDSLEQDIFLQLEKIEILRQSILKLGLSGQLVAQNTADEPARVLLERIRSKRMEGGTPNRRNYKNRKKEAA